MIDIERERQEFEAWAMRAGYGLTILGKIGDSGAYERSYIQWAWQAWLARADRDGR